jgi:hypothetical protein
MRLRCIGGAMLVGERFNGHPRVAAAQKNREIVFGVMFG